MRKILFVSLILFITTIRVIVIPYALTLLIQNEFGQSKEFQITYDRLNLSVWQLKYSLSNLHVDTKFRSSTFPILTASQIEFSLAWDQLLRGKIEASIVVHNPELRCTQHHLWRNTPNPNGDAWMQSFKNLSLIPIHAIKIVNGSIQHTDGHENPESQFLLSEINLKASNLQTASSDARRHGSYMIGTAKAANGFIAVEMQFDAPSTSPHFKMKAELRNLDMISISGYLKSTYNYKVNEGTFGMYTEVSGEDYKISGFVVSRIDHIELVNSHTTQKTFSALQTGNSLSRTIPEVPFEDTIDYRSSTSIWNAAVFTLRSAFHHAIDPIVHPSFHDDERLDIRPKMNPSPHFNQRGHKSLS